jgi:hypothetical protein
MPLYCHLGFGFRGFSVRRQNPIARNFVFLNRSNWRSGHSLHDYLSQANGCGFHSIRRIVACRRDHRLAIARRHCNERFGIRRSDEIFSRCLPPSGPLGAVVSLPMLAVLKILAWSERQTLEPQKDAPDLLLILQNYLDAGNSDGPYSEAGQLLEHPNFDCDRVRAWLAGKNALKQSRGIALKQMA